MADETKTTLDEVMSKAAEDMTDEDRDMIVLELRKARARWSTEPAAKPAKRNSAITLKDLGLE